jgi:hypothetical protein
MKKIVRVFFDFEGNQFCIDRPYNMDMDDQGNCDTALKILIDSMHSSTIVPALKLVDNDKDQKSEHVFVNLGMLSFVKIVNVLVYAPKEDGATHES